MNNVSLNGEPIELSVTIKYIVIDALYINEIRAELAHLKRDDIFDEIRNIVFPYTYNPFAEFVPEGKVFRIDQIKNVDFDKIDLMLMILVFLRQIQVLSFLLIKNYS